MKIINDENQSGRHILNFFNEIVSFTYSAIDRLEDHEDDKEYFSVTTEYSVNRIKNLLTKINLELDNFNSDKRL
jgi:hypothetical protein